MATTAPELETTTRPGKTRIGNHESGLIAVPCNDLARYTLFTLSLATCDMPKGTQISMVRSMDVTANLNVICRGMMKTDAQWVWFQGDDHVWEPDLLTTLLDHEVDVVVPLIAKKNPPFNLVVFKDSHMAISEDDGKEYRNYVYYEPSELPIDAGLVEVHAAGSGGMLVRRHVLEAIGDPWFESSHGTIVNDDLEFCQKIKSCGYKIWCDPSVSMGHISQYTVRPGIHHGMRGVSLDFGGTGQNVIFMSADLGKLNEEAKAKLTDPEALA